MVNYFSSITYPYLSNKYPYVLMLPVMSDRCCCSTRLLGRLGPWALAEEVTDLGHGWQLGVFRSQKWWENLQNPEQAEPNLGAFGVLRSVSVEKMVVKPTAMVLEPGCFGFSAPPMLFSAPGISKKLSQVDLGRAQAGRMRQHKNLRAPETKCLVPDLNRNRLSRFTFA